MTHEARAPLPVVRGRRSSPLGGRPQQNAAEHRRYSTTVPHTPQRPELSTKTGRRRSFSDHGTNAARCSAWAADIDRYLPPAPQLRQGRLNQWAHWARAQGPGFFEGPQLAVVK